MIPDIEQRKFLPQTNYYFNNSYLSIGSLMGQIDNYMLDFITSTLSDLKNYLDILKYSKKYTIDVNYFYSIVIVAKT